MKNGLIIFSGAVETLEFFSRQLAKEYNTDGYEIFIYRIDKEKDDLSDMKQFILSHNTTMLTFNFIGLSGEKCFNDKVSTWDSFNLSIINIIVDHPIYYHSLLEQADANINLYCIDEDHISYIKKYYPQIENVNFLPLAGSKIQVAKESKIEDRPYKILFAGNYVRKENLLNYLNDIDTEYKEFYLSIVEDLKINTAKSIQEAMESHIYNLFPNATNKEMSDAMHGMLFVDLYIRSYFRAEVIKKIVEAKIPIHLIGKDWEYLDTKNQDYIIRLGNGMENTRFCLEQIKNTKLSLNIMPWFKKGFHDRIPSSMLNGSVSITDSSTYINKNFKDGQNILLYDLNKIEEIPELIYQVINNKKLLKDIMQGGKIEAENNHTWKNRYNILKKTVS